MRCRLPVLGQLGWCPHRQSTTRRKAEGEHEMEDAGELGNEDRGMWILDKSLTVGGDKLESLIIGYIGT